MHDGSKYAGTTCLWVSLESYINIVHIPCISIALFTCGMVLRYFSIPSLNTVSEACITGPNCALQSYNMVIHIQCGLQLYFAFLMHANC